MTIAKATASYEGWLNSQLRLIPRDLRYKHEQMRSAPFPFLRATYYRWAQIWPDVCPDSAGAPEVLAVGDLHVENFGTWRDAEGRLVWGINDFDEAWPLPYTNDLVRLATSALLAPIRCDAASVVGAIREGYEAALEAGGRPFTLSEHHHALRLMATSRLHEPQKFWEKLGASPALREPPPASALKALTRAMPEQDLALRLSHRIAGLGSLGRERYVAIAEWGGGLVAREAKALAPSASVWAAKGKPGASIRYREIVDGAVRCPDPFLRVQKRWIVRRLAPDCSRIELAALPKERDELLLLRAMGWETANIHLGSAKARRLAADLDRRGPGWLLADARKMRRAVLDDFKAWSRR
jgi:hypothetical protein